MIEQVTFESTNLYTTYGLILAKKQITPPRRKTLIIDVPSRDGTLDITEGVYGQDAIYENREITLKFIALEDSLNMTSDEFETQLLTEYNGKNLKIKFSNDIGYYYYGRCELTDYSCVDGRIDVSFYMSADPYKYLVSDPTQKSL